MLEESLDLYFDEQPVGHVLDDVVQGPGATGARATAGATLDDFAATQLEVTLVRGTPFELPSDGLLLNLVSFNIGVELGQFVALAYVLIAFGYWRRSPSFFRMATSANVALMSSGFVLVGFQLTGYFVSEG